MNSPRHSSATAMRHHRRTSSKVSATNSSTTEFPIPLTPSTKSSGISPSGSRSLSTGFEAKRRHFPTKPSGGFPSESRAASETWDQLRHRFLQTAEQAAASARDTGRLDEP